MRIDLTNYNATPTSTIRIYRSYETFTETNLPPFLVEIPATSTEYLDNTVELNRLVYYRTSVIHNASEVVGPLYITMKKYYTGPQVNVERSEPDMILRGDARIGRYGTLTMGQVYPADQIPEDFSTMTLIEGVDPVTMKVEKCIFDDRILFISDSPMYTGSLEDLYNAGMLFSFGDGDGKSRMATTLYDSITTKVQQGKLVHANGFTYRPRLLTQAEYEQLYIKLFPSSVMGETQDCILANCLLHNYESVILSSDKVGLTNNPTIRLNGQTGRTDWVSKRPILMVLELVSRADSAFPDIPADFKPTLPDDRMMMCGGEIVNNRVHFFGGIYSTFTTGMAATTRHISFNLDGEDEQVHAPLPVGVYQPVTWTHNNKIFSFGGVKKIGSTEWSFQEIFSGLQVWEDNGTPEGLWTESDTNVTYGFGSCGTVYFDSGLNQNRIMIIGGYDSEQTGIADNYYSADVTTFDGTFEVNKSYFSRSTGGGSVAPYGPNLMWATPTTMSNGLTSNMYKIQLPVGQPPLWPKVTQVYTQGSELPASQRGKLFVWRDTLFLITSSSFTNKKPEFYIYQWAPNESRWLQITVSAAGLDTSNWWMGTTAVNNNRIYVLVSLPWLNDTSPSKLMIMDLVDPLDAALQQVNEITPVVDRLYPPYPQVTL